MAQRGPDPVRPEHVVIIRAKNHHADQCSAPAKGAPDEKESQRQQHRIQECTDPQRDIIGGGTCEHHIRNRQPHRRRVSAVILHASQVIARTHGLTEVAHVDLERFPTLGGKARFDALDLSTLL